MRTRSSSNLPVESPPNPSTSNPKHRIRKRSKQPFILEESFVDTMADQRTMAELLRAFGEGYAEEIVVPPILTEQFELKHSLINMMTSDQFFALEKENPHDYICWFNKLTSTIKYKDVPNSTIKLMLFPFSLAGAAHRWLKKEPPHSILTWEDLVSKFINKFFPPSRTTNLRNEISNFQQRFDESFHEAWDRYKDLLHTCPQLRYNIQGYVSAAAINYNQGLGSLPSNTIANPKGEIKAITTRCGIVLDGPSVPIPPLFINPGEDEHVEETLTDQDLIEYTIKVPPLLVQKSKPPSQRNFFVHQRDPLHPNIPYPLRMLKQKQQEKDEVQIYKFWPMFKQLYINITLVDTLILIPKYQKILKALLSSKEKILELENTPLNENCLVVILKNLPEKLRDPGKFLIPCGFSELKCKAIANLGASVNLMPLFVGKLTFPADFVIVDYESDPRVPLILGRPFLRTARALIDVHGEEMILCDSDERLNLNMRHDTSSYSSQPQKESINMINIYDNSMLKPLFPSPIPIKDSDSFLEKFDTSLAYSDHSFHEYETFRNHMQETNSGSTTTQVDYSLPKYDSYLFKIKPDQGKLTSIVMKANLAEPRVHVPNVLTIHPTLMLDSYFIPYDNSLPKYDIFYFDIEEKNIGSTTIHADNSFLDLECFNFDFKPDPGELTSIVDSGICENVLTATNVNLPLEEDHSPLFAYVVWIFLSFLTYPVVPPNLLSFKNKDTIFDPGISNYHFPSLLPDVSHRCETFMKFNVYPKLLNESSMEILSSSMEQ
uniref:Reverse transcriptase domain-containing protein n=1 Tax=Tanacetum cinerariifolium TaxID=118510 RepID=A0A699I1L9_TANCI|nr:reverse transcriptase domain-containing protein [Tanacetum cinerariifolium]